MLQNPFDLIDQRLANIEGLLLDIKHPPLHANIKKTEFITRQEAADILRVLYKKNEIEEAITEISTNKKRRI